MKNLMFKLYFLFLGLLCPSLVRSQTILPAEITATYAVTSTGAFNYALPIEIPPGIKEMMPNLAISYNSQGANGMLGTGWTISGLSAIGRSKPTVYHNQTLDPVNFNSNDVFMLDGQRLFLTGTNEYMTEIKNFSHIKSFGTIGNGPNYFTVEYPTGIVYEYGNSANSKLVAPGTPNQDALVWQVNKIYDKYGNYIEFDYGNQQLGGINRLNYIVYGINSNTSQAGDTIKFNYTGRQDPNILYAIGAGASIMDNHVLSSVEVVASSGATVNRYDFTYDLTKSTTHLKEIKETRPNNTILPPVTVKWGSIGVDDASNTSWTTAPSPPGLGYEYICGDFNGDGATDAARSSYDTSLNIFEVALSNKMGDLIHDANWDESLTFKPSNSYFHKISTNQGARMIVDFNGDGLDDIVLIEPRLINSVQGFFRMHLFTATEIGFDYDGVIFEYENNSYCGPACTPTTEYYIADIRVVPGDFDGDGFSDFLVFIPSDLTASPKKGEKFDAFLVGGAYHGAGPLYNLGNYGKINFGSWAEVGKIQHEIWAAVPLEFDGDGKTDLLVTSDGDGFQNSDSEIWHLNPTYVNDEVVSAGTLSIIYYGGYPSHDTRITNGNGIEDKIWPGDFNGDGADDLLTWSVSSSTGHPGVWEIRYSTGNGWHSANGSTLPLNELNTTAPWFEDDWSYQVADFNGDGKADILQSNVDVSTTPAVRNYRLYYSLGAHLFEKDMGLFPDTFSVWSGGQYLGDFDGDGQTDILSSVRFAPKLIYFRKNDQRNLVTSIEHAGKEISIQHKTLSSASPDTEDEDHYGYNEWNIGGIRPRYGPYFSKQLALDVVTQLKDNISLFNTYYYQTLSLHRAGLGMLGFEKIRIKQFDVEKVKEDHYSLFPWWGTQQGYSIVSFLFETSEWSMLGAKPLLFHKKFSYFDVPGHSSVKEVRIIKNYDIITTNYATGENTDYVMEFSNSAQFLDFGLPDWTYESKSVHNGYIIDSVVYTYDQNLLFHNRGKPVSVRKTTTYPSKTPYTRTVNYSYNSNGLLADEFTDPNTSNLKRTSFTYDPTYGNLVTTYLQAPGSSLPPVTNAFEYSTDGKFQVKSTKFLGSHAYTDSFARNIWGKVVHHKAFNTLETRYTYDAINRVIKIISPTDGETNIEYDWAYDRPNDNPGATFSDYQAITQNEHESQFAVMTWRPGYSNPIDYFDFYGRKIRSVSYGVQAQRIYHDTRYEHGKVKHITDPYFKNTTAEKTNYTYDELNREFIKSKTNGPSLMSSYNVSIVPGYMETTVTNMSTAQQRITSQDAGGLYRIIDNGNTIEYDFSSNGKPIEISINSKVDFTTTFEYDDYARLLRKIEPNSGNVGSPTVTYEYNAYDQIESETDANTIEYTYAYDNLGKVLSKTEGNGNGFFYNYYNLPNSPETGLIQDESTNYGTNIASYKYEYDQAARIKKLTEKPDNQHSYVTEYGYDPWDPLESTCRHASLSIL